MVIKVHNNVMGCVYDGAARSHFPSLIKLADGTTITLDMNEIQYFSELRNAISKTDFETLLDNITTAKESTFFPGNFVGSEGLPLKVQFEQRTRLLTILSHGEVQPGRYKMYLEGVFEVFDIKDTS